MMCAGSNNTFDARSFTIFEIDFNTVHVGKARHYHGPGNARNKIILLTHQQWHFFRALTQN